MAYQNNQGSNQGNQSSDYQGFRQRQMVDVSTMNIKCCECGAEIKELPFNPDPARLDQIRCRDCMRKRRQQFRRRY
jgi:DNA-directed RNA polymerase subunit RPC12/RpoP